MATSTTQSDRPLLPRLRSSELWSYFGPAFVASIAYIDPGNFATNLTADRASATSCSGCCCGRMPMAILIQYLAAKLGIATGKTLPQNCRAHSQSL